MFTPVEERRCTAPYFALRPNFTGAAVSPAYIERRCELQWRSFTITTGPRRRGAQGPAGVGWHL